MEETCEIEKDTIPGCDVDCSSSEFIAPTFISFASVLFFVYRALFH